MCEFNEFIGKIRDEHPDQVRIFEEMNKILDQFEEKKYKYGTIKTNIST